MKITKEIAIHCLKSYSQRYNEVCEDCPIYGKTGNDHCFGDVLQYAINMLETSENKIEGEWEPCSIAIRKGTLYKCSICTDVNDYPKTYCPNCGSPMKGIKNA